MQINPSKYIGSSLTPTKNFWQGKYRPIGTVRNTESFLLAGHIAHEHILGDLSLLLNYR